MHAGPRTFLRPSSSSSVRGQAWSFSSGLTKGEACLVSGLRLGDKITLAGTAPPWELMDSSERWGLPVREPIGGWEVLEREKKKSNSFWDRIATYNSPPYQIFRTLTTILHIKCASRFSSFSLSCGCHTIVWMGQWSQSSVIEKAENSAQGMFRSIVDPQMGPSSPYYCLASTNYSRRTVSIPPGDTRKD